MEEQSAIDFLRSRGYVVFRVTPELKPELKPKPEPVIKVCEYCGGEFSVLAAFARSKDSALIRAAKKHIMHIRKPGNRRKTLKMNE